MVSLKDSKKHKTKKTFEIKSLPHGKVVADTYTNKIILYISDDKGRYADSSRVHVEPIDETHSYIAKQNGKTFNLKPHQLSDNSFGLSEGPIELYRVKESEYQLIGTINAKK